MATNGMATNGKSNGVHSDGLRFKDKVLVVTGGAGGIGYGVAKTFVQHGAKVAFSDIDEAGGKKAEKELNEMGPGQCKFVLCNMMVEEQIKAFINDAKQTFGRIDCLFNNAGTHPPHLPIEEVSTSDFQELFDLNVKGYFSATKYALPHLRETQGSIINNSSLVAVIGQPQAVSYVATKGAILSMTKAFAVDEAAHNVRVNSIAPGNVWTPLWEKAAIASENYDVVVQGGRDSQLLGRFGTIEECGLTCLYLAADATFCTGININLTGGAELDYGRKTKKGTPNSLYN